MISLLGLYYRPSNGQLELEEQTYRKVVESCKTNRVVTVGDLYFHHVD